jgi:arsenate reductase
MSDKHKLLFVCIHNSARSQMAEAFLKKYGEDLFEVESASPEPASINPNVVVVMGEVGIDLRQQTREVRDEIEEKVKEFANESRQISYWI